MRYISVPNAQWELWDRPATVQSTMTVYEQEDKPTDTGLVDATGTRLYRISERIKIGYV